MELGGNAPFLVFDDADLDAAVEGAMIAKMRNIGEACTAANRFHVAESVAGRVRREARRANGAMKVGRGTEDDVKVGPLIDGDQRDKVAELVDDALAPRAPRSLVGGARATAPATSTSRPCSPASPATRELLREEIFGPVAPVIGFDDEEEAIAAANDTEYGLVAYVYTATSSARSASSRGSRPAWSASTRAWSPTPAAPFGGVKQSGFGREGGHEGIEEYLETKYVAIEYGTRFPAEVPRPPYWGGYRLRPDLDRVSGRASRPACTNGFGTVARARAGARAPPP